VSVDCLHLAQLADAEPGTPGAGCAECLRMGATWVHLRRCQSCGHVGCCDESANRHAREHYRATRHPVVRSVEAGESWSWCFVDSIEYDPAYDWTDEGADLS
jgi:uncharacterized UBP type Zn finger protein